VIIDGDLPLPDPSQSSVFFPSSNSLFARVFHFLSIRRSDSTPLLVSFFRIVDGTQTGDILS